MPKCCTMFIVFSWSDEKISLKLVHLIFFPHKQILKVGIKIILGALSFETRDIAMVHIKIKITWRLQVIRL